MYSIPLSLRSFVVVVTLDNVSIGSRNVVLTELMLVVVPSILNEFPVLTFTFPEEFVIFNPDTVVKFIPLVEFTKLADVSKVILV